MTAADNPPLVRSTPSYIRCASG